MSAHLKFSFYFTNKAFFSLRLGTGLLQPAVEKRLKLQKFYNCVCLIGKLAF